MAAKLKRLAVDPDDVSYVVTKDGEILVPDKSNHMICINEHKFSSASGDGMVMPSAEMVRSTLKLSETLNNPGGINYEMTRKILEKYRFFAFTEGIKEELKENYAERMEPKQSVVSKRFVLNLSDDDDLKDVIRLMAEQKHLPKKVQKFVKNTDNILFSAMIVDIIEDVIDSFINSPSNEYKEAGKLIYDKYVDPKYANKDASFFLKKAGKANNAYYMALKKATSFVSPVLFGNVPQDNSILEINFAETGIVVDVSKKFQ